MQGTNVAVGLIGLALLTPAVCIGQTPPKIEFETASMRPSSFRLPGEEKPLNGIRSGGPGTPEPGVVTYSRVPLDQIIADAFDLSWDRIAGPGWISVERYDIVGRIRQDSTALAARTGDEIFLMLQNLLMERLRLTFHVQTKILPGYELVAGPAGAKLKESQGGVAAAWRAAPPAILSTKDSSGFPILPAGVRQGMAIEPGRVRATFRDTAMSEFAQYLGTRLGTRFAPGAAPAAKRLPPAAVLDKTGLEGRYNFTFDDGANLQGFASAGSGLNRALDAQLGLKLVPAKVAVDFLVVDHVEKTPAAN